MNKQVFSYKERVERRKKAHQYAELLLQSPDSAAMAKEWAEKDGVYDLTVEIARQRIIKQIEENMIPVKGGGFTMGSNEGNDDEKPVHHAYMRDFAIAKYTLTAEEYNAVMRFPDFSVIGDRRPKVKINWHECNYFCEVLSRETGNQYSLPTEAQWEYAAKGATRTRHCKYAGSNDITKVAWHAENSGSRLQPVGNLAPNEIGTYDMSGNTWEWCLDKYDRETYNHRVKFMQNELKAYKFPVDAGYNSVKYGVYYNSKEVPTVILSNDILHEYNFRKFSTKKIKRDNLYANSKETVKIPKYKDGFFELMRYEVTIDRIV